MSRILFLLLFISMFIILSYFTYNKYYPYVLLISFITIGMLAYKYGIKNHNGIIVKELTIFNVLVVTYLSLFLSIIINCPIYTISN
jgi:hypothetical protein